MQLIDTHVHINFEVYQTELDELRSRWQSAGVVHLIHSCVDPSEFKRTQAIADRFPELSFAVGLHPLEAHQWTDDMGAEILTLARSDRRVVAIGETGLDFFKAENAEQQKSAFLTQLDIALELNLPVIIHCRDAAAEMVQVLRQFWETRSAVPGVMHCWTGNPQETQWFLDLGFYISFSGVVTFKNAQSIQASAQMVPFERLLVETDCPFLAPVPQRGKRNEPAYVQHVAQYVADLRGVSIDTLAARTTENARSLFGLSE